MKNHIAVNCMLSVKQVSADADETRATYVSQNKASADSTTATTHCADHHSKMHMQFVRYTPLSL